MKIHEAIAPILGLRILKITTNYKECVPIPKTLSTIAKYMWTLCANLFVLLLY